MVVYEFSTVARQEATQSSAEVNVVFSAQHMKVVQTNNKAPHWCAQRDMRRSVKGPKTYIKPVWGMVSKSDRQKRNSACPESQAWRRVRLAGNQNMY